jgi:hypothetical protein
MHRLADGIDPDVITTVEAAAAQSVPVVVYAHAGLSEAVAPFQLRDPRAVQAEFDAMASAGVGESCFVLVGECREFLEPALASARRKDFDDPRWLVGRIPHGVLDVARLERPLASASGANFIADQDADLPGLDSYPYVIAVHVIRDQDPGSESLADHREHPVGVLGAYLHLDLEWTWEGRSRFRNNHVWR